MILFSTRTELIERKRWISSLDAIEDGQKQSLSEGLAWDFFKHITNTCAYYADGTGTEMDGLVMMVIMSHTSA